ncbi:hypothetical protein [Paenibacillus tyrfis]|uniref:Uncharacterized protein n=1 Tax=Paenibacillus tyrfis TaxID=1501230 RepID=A0A081NYJ5_9BACL|nr:hypothetical protein [Paenibacillus tyrfis]KEQ23518.1 hypothetical protein ET33_15400 [Paenibacillus tyrfis]
MGLDIILYDDKGARAGFIEIPSSLHEAIFMGMPPLWSSYPYLSKIKDYYKTNIRFHQPDLHHFVEDLKQIRLFMDSTYHAALDCLIDALSQSHIQAIYVAGD